MIQQETRLQVADNTGAKNFCVFVYWEAQTKNLQQLAM